MRDRCCHFTQRLSFLFLSSEPTFVLPSILGYRIIYRRSIRVFLPRNAGSERPVPFKIIVIWIHAASQQRRTPKHHLCTHAHTHAHACAALWFCRDANDLRELSVMCSTTESINRRTRNPASSSVLKKLGPSLAVQNSRRALDNSLPASYFYIIALQKSTNLRQGRSTQQQHDELPASAAVSEQNNNNNQHTQSIINIRLLQSEAIRGRPGPS